MADPKALEKLAGIEGKLADLTELGKEMRDVEDPAKLLALQEKFKALLRSFEEQVREIQRAMIAAGMKPPKFKLDLDPAEAALVRAQTGRDVQFVELDEAPPRALTREELVALAIAQAGKA